MYRVLYIRASGKVRIMKEYLTSIGCQSVRDCDPLGRYLLGIL